MIAQDKSPTFMADQEHPLFTSEIRSTPDFFCSLEWTWTRKLASPMAPEHKIQHGSWLSSPNLCAIGHRFEPLVITGREPSAPRLWTRRLGTSPCSLSSLDMCRQMRWLVWCQSRCVLGADWLFIPKTPFLPPFLWMAFQELRSLRMRNSSHPAHFWWDLLYFPLHHHSLLPSLFHCDPWIKNRVSPVFGKCSTTEPVASQWWFPLRKWLFQNVTRIDFPWSPVKCNWSLLNQFGEYG